MERDPTPYTEIVLTLKKSDSCYYKPISLVFFFQIFGFKSLFDVLQTIFTTKAYLTFVLAISVRDFGLKAMISVVTHLDPILS